MHALESSFNETDRDFRKVLKSILFAASTKKDDDDDDDDDDAENAACAETQRRKKRKDSILLLMMSFCLFMLRNVCKDKKLSLMYLARVSVQFTRACVFVLCVYRARA